MTEFAFILALHVLGVLFSSLWARRLPVHFLAVTGLVWGSLFWVVLVAAFLSTGIRVTPATAAGAILMLAAGFGYAQWRLRTVSLAALKVLALDSLLMACFFFLVVRYNCACATPDSTIMLELGKSIGHFGTASADQLALFRNWGAFVVLIEAAGPLLDLDYLHGILPSFAVAVFVGFYALSHRALCGLTSHRLTIWLLPLVAIGLLLSSYGVLLLSFYINNHLVVAGYVLFYLACLWLALHERRDAWLVFAWLSLLGLTLARCEGGVVALLLLCPLAAAPEILWRRKAIFVLSYAILVEGWLAVTLGGGGKEQLVDRRLWVAVMGLLGLFSAGVVASRWRPIGRLAKYLPTAALYVIAIALAACTFMSQTHMTQCFTAIMGNLGKAGRWGSIWYFLAAGLAAAVLLPRLPHRRVVFSSVIGFILLTALLGYFRIPYRAGFFDSANRMLMHILPAALFGLVLQFGMIARRPRLGGIRGNLVAVGIALLAGAATLVVARSALAEKDYAKRARAIEGPEFCQPPSHRQSHAMAVALRGVVDDRYVASRSTAPLTVTLDLGSTVKASLLLLHQYAASEAFEDYALAVSLDGENWLCVFDTQVPGRSVLYEAGPLETGYDLRDAGTFRYVRLELRKAKGQNRLLLRRLRILPRDSLEVLRPENRQDARSLSTLD